VTPPSQGIEFHLALKMFFLLDLHGSYWNISHKPPPVIHDRLNLSTISNPIKSSDD